MVHTPTKMQNQLVENCHSGQAPAFLSLFFLLSQRISFPSVLISVCLFLSSYTAEVDSEVTCPLPGNSVFPAVCDSAITPVHHYCCALSPPYTGRLLTLVC